MRSVRQICTFFLNQQLFGLEVDYVLEVVHSHPVTPVPLAPDSVRGLINLRGQVITSIDLRRRLELPLKEAPSRKSRMKMVVRTKEGPMCFPIDDVGDVLEIPTDQFEPLPETASPAAQRFVESVCTLPNQVLLVLKSEFSVL